ncbi:MAG: pseudaminic acid cytidylyltransferase [Pseudomonadota bacterium]
MAVVVIPARGGSKRIPRKNLKSFHGKPIIAWSIAAARQAETVTRIIVSTDDDEITEVAQTHGAEVPFRRDEALSNDHAGTVEVIRDAVVRLDLVDDLPVCCLYATAPLVTGEMLDAGLAELRRTRATFAFPVADLGPRAERVYHRTGDRIAPAWPDMMPRRSQDLPVSWFDTGQFYWGLARDWRRPDALLWENAAGIEMSRDRVQDIDTTEDWMRAERIFADLRNDETSND